METCPQCGRRLISHTSPKCNWCGTAIVDAEYQAQAQVNRVSYFAEEALHNAQSLAFYQRAMTPYPTVIGSPPFGMPSAYYRFQQRQADLAASQAATAQYSEQLQAQAVSEQERLAGAPQSAPIEHVEPSLEPEVLSRFPSPPGQNAAPPKTDIQDTSKTRFGHLEL